MSNNSIDDNKVTLFVQVILPLPLDSFTYRIPFHLNEQIAIGQLVAVSFGRKTKKLYGGIVSAISERAPSSFQAAYIQEIVEEIPLISEQQLTFWKWMSSYYQTRLGDVMIAALPSGLRLSGETRIYANKEELINPEVLDAKELEILALIDGTSYVTPEQLQKELSLVNPLKYLRSLYDKGLVKVADEINKNFKPKTRPFVSLIFNPKNEHELETAFEKVKKSPKQSQLLLQLINEPEEIDKRDLLSKTGISAAVFNGVLKKGLIKVYHKALSRFEIESNKSNKLTLSHPQREAVSQIESGFKQKKPVLLFGPTASGKTYVYLNLIKKALTQGKQVLYLLPEIALTEQAIFKLQEFLGEEVLVTHSKYSIQHRAEIWDLLRSKAVNVIVGPRSAIFSPFYDLDLIVVDEEHESSFKQNDKAPRFHGRDAALMLGKIWGANVLLGSATPSIESMFASERGKLQKVILDHKYTEHGEIHFETVNLKESLEKNKMIEMFSFEMIEALKENIEKQRQAIIFHNRKGFVPVTTCTSCGWVPHCINCDIALTYYKYNNEMRCHYCGFKSQPPSNCSDCGSNALEIEGYGTEKITEELRKILPDIQIERFDQESTRKKTEHKRIMEGFKTGSVQILVGTQLLAKGFDFENVDFVGVVNADHMLHFPNFRAGERTFQLLTQVAGRTGRRERSGRVMLQSYRPDHPVIQSIIHNDYYGFYNSEIQDRKSFAYPPFTRLIFIQVKDFDALQAEKAARHLGMLLKNRLGQRIVGPAKPSIAKINRWYLREILVRMDKKKDNILAIKAEIQTIVDQFNFLPDYKKSRVIINVDPV